MILMLLNKVKYGRFCHEEFLPPRGSVLRLIENRYSGAEVAVDFLLVHHF